MKTSTFLLTSSFILLTSSFSRAAERVETPEAWKILPVNGKTFINGTFGDEPSWKLWDNYPDEPMFETLWLWLSGSCPKGDRRLCHENLYKENESWYLKDCKVQMPLPAKITDALKRWGDRGKLVDRFAARRPNDPIEFSMWDGRPSWALKDAYDNDLAHFDQWLGKHPGFVGFQVYDETDSDLTWFRARRENGRMHDPATLAYADAEFPICPFNEFYRPWMKKCGEKATTFYWQTKRKTGLVSNLPSMVFAVIAGGANFLWYEAESGNCGVPWRWGGAYARGAARQAQIPLGWYMAHLLVRSQTRDGSKPKVNLGEAGHYIHWPNVANRNPVTHTGQARSLIHRNEFYGMMIGATAEMIEGGHYMLTGIDPVDTNKVVFSPYGEDYRDIFRWQKTHDRGVLYTPVALLTSADEVFEKQTYLTAAKNHDVYAQSAFMNSLVCPQADKTGYQHLVCQRPEKGEQGLLWNSEFGEIADVLSPDVGQKTEDFHKVLKCYKAAILVGWFNKKYFDRSALERYVKEGGTLYAENRHVEMGLIPATVDGAKGKIVLTDSFYDPRLTADNGKWSWDKTRMLYSGEIDNAKIKNLLRSLQDRYMPVKVEGDIQWGVNLVEGGEVEKFREIAQKGEATSRRFDEKGNGKGNEGNTIAATVRSDEDVASPLPPHHSTTPPLHRSTTPPPHHSTTSPHWLVWLINNKGVTKWLLEPEELDLSKTANVKITDRKTGKVYTASVKPGGFATIEIPFE